MLFVKIKNTTNEITTFEVISRSPLNYMEFDLDRSEFNNVFASAKEDMINTNISNNKDNIFKCIDELFETKLIYWNQNLSKVAPIYKSIYEMDKGYKIGSVYELIEQEDIYKNEIKGDFHKDFKFFRTLFRTAKEAIYDKNDFMCDKDVPRISKEEIYASRI